MTRIPKSTLRILRVPILRSLARNSMAGQCRGADPVSLDAGSPISTRPGTPMRRSGPTGELSSISTRTSISEGPSSGTRSPILAQRAHRVGQPLVSDLEWKTACDELEEEDTERVDVRSRVQSLPLSTRLLGAHVGERSDEVTQPRHEAPLIVEICRQPFEARGVQRSPSSGGRGVLGVVHGTRSRRQGQESFGIDWLRLRSSCARPRPGKRRLNIESAAVIAPSGT